MPRRESDDNGSTERQIAYLGMRLTSSCTSHNMHCCWHSNLNRGHAAPASSGVASRRNGLWPDSLESMIVLVNAGSSCELWRVWVLRRVRWAGYWQTPVMPCRIPSATPPLLGLARSSATHSKLFRVWVSGAYRCWVGFARPTPAQESRNSGAG